MLTLEKLRTYRRFGGDIDGWARTHGRGDTSGITDDDWSLIDELRQGLRIVSSGQASVEFASYVERRLLASTADDQTREQLRELAK
jgi:hypothetical protein